jgi:hypothetical protein
VADSLLRNVAVRLTEVVRTSSDSGP